MLSALAWCITFNSIIFFVRKYFPINEIILSCLNNGDNRYFPLPSVYFMCTPHQTILYESPAIFSLLSVWWRDREYVCRFCVIDRIGNPQIQINFIKTVNMRCVQFNISFWFRESKYLTYVCVHMGQSKLSTSHCIVIIEPTMQTELEKNVIFFSSI